MSPFTIEMKAVELYYPVMLFFFFSSMLYHRHNLIPSPKNVGLYIIRRSIKEYRGLEGITVVTKQPKSA